MHDAKEGLGMVKEQAGGHQFDDQVDLRYLFAVLLARWRWILVFAITSAFVAGAVSLLMPKQYKVTAYVVLTKPDVIFRFDPRIETDVQPPSGKDLADLALAGDILQQVLQDPAASTLDQQSRQVDKFRQSLSASLSEAVIKLGMRDIDPERLKTLANVWAEVLTNRLNELYAPAARAEDRFTDQAEEALVAWQEAQAAYSEFQTINREPVLAKRLEAQEAALALYLDQERSIGIVLQNAEVLKARLETRDPQIESSLPDDLSTLLVTAQALLGTNSDSGVPASGLDLQFQVTGNSFIELSLPDQISYLDSLIDGLQRQQNAASEEAEELTGTILDLQGELAQVQQERIRLEQVRNLAQEAHLTLARKAQETALASSDTETVARVASRAVRPSQPVSPRIVTNVGIAALVGLFLGGVIVYLIEWWRGVSY
jgi:capsular polysaccharide biosynthesis protein